MSLEIQPVYSLCTAVPLPSKKSERERLWYDGINRVPRRVVSPECVGNYLIGFHLNYFNLFCIIPKRCFYWLKFSRVLCISWSNSKSFQRARESTCYDEFIFNYLQKLFSQ